VDENLNEIKLTNKQKVFINEYLISFNATEAALKAGYSPKTAYSQGARLLKVVEIKEALRLKLTETAMSSEEVLKRLAEMARGDMADLMEITASGFTLKLSEKNEDGTITVNPKTKLIRKIKQKVTTFLAKNESQEDREVIETELELYSAQDALQLLGKYHALFVDRTELTGKDNGNIVVELVHDKD
jgi:phage terminase small subunit